MNIFRIAAELFLIYILYKLIFDFIVPVYNSTKKIKKQFGDMHEKMQQDMNAMNSKQAQAHSERKVKREGDYIDYEEIK
jgi:uncharacterized protein YneF (UPF0154 family)